jgi:1-acyl-sn-glycerol-3-phosphate acyltransferase
VLYGLIRGVVSLALRRFYRLEVVSRVQDLSGPVMFVGNHPNSLIDPALVFVITDRPVTFLAREPLFRVPVMGWVLRSLKALPVYRKQDHPGLMEKNEGTLEAAAGALAEGKAITIFPEGKSHSAPQLQEIKTGCARIALKVARGGVALRIVPVGLTYEQKHRFRSQVHVEVGEPVLVTAAAALEPGAEQEWVRALTQRVHEALRTVTLNLETWDDVGLLETADRLLALRHGFQARDPVRLRLMARAASLLRDEDPERFDELKDDVLSFRARLALLRADDGVLTAHRDAPLVGRFALRNVARLLLGFPVFLVGLVLFAAPFLALRTLALVLPLSRDRVATLKLVGTLVLVPAWWALLCAVGALALGWPGFLAALVGSIPLALYTRYFYEQRSRHRADARALSRLPDGARLRDHLLHEGERLQDELSRLAAELGPRVS